MEGIFSRLFDKGILLDVLIVAIFCGPLWWHDWMMEKLMKEEATIKTSGYLKWSSYLALAWPVLVAGVFFWSPADSVAALGFKTQVNILATGWTLGATGMLIAAAVIYSHLWQPWIKHLKWPILLGLFSLCIVWLTPTHTTAPNQLTHSTANELLVGLILWGLVFSTRTWWLLLYIH